MFDSTQVIALFENREVKPTAFKYRDAKYSVKEILKIMETENPFFAIAGIKDRMYWIVTQDGTRAVLHWHRNTGEWTVEKIFPAN